MIRKLKVLGLVMVAVFAMSAVASAAASAHTFSSEGNVTTKFSGEQEGTNTFTIDGTALECSTAKFASVGETKSPTETGQALRPRERRLQWTGQGRQVQRSRR